MSAAKARVCLARRVDAVGGHRGGKSKPVHITTDQENLLADLKEGLAYVRRGKGGKKINTGGKT